MAYNKMEHIRLRFADYSVKPLTIEEVMHQTPLNEIKYKKVLRGLGFLKAHCLMDNRLDFITDCRSGSWNRQYSGRVGIVTERFLRLRVRYDLVLPAFGEGIWGGAVVAVAGAIAIAAGGKRSNYCLINTHMGIAVFGAVASVFQFSLSIVSSIINFSLTALPWFVIVDLTTLASLVLLIVSASYCCRAVLPCCQVCCAGSTQQVVIVTGSHQQPMVSQDGATISQVYQVPNYQPVTSVVPVQADVKVQPA